MAALTGLEENAAGGGGWLRGTRNRQRVREAVAYLDVLAGMCPEPGHLASYAAMITGARSGPAVPEQAGADEQLASADSWLAERGDRGRRGGRAASGPGAANGETIQDHQVASLARALRPAVESRVEAARKALAAQGSPAPGPGAGGTGASAGGQGRAAQPGVSRESVQRMVLADLMRRPGEGRSAVARIPVEMFAPGPLRQLYELVSERITSGQAVDPVIIAWEAGQRHGSEPAAGAPAGWSLPAIALRIGATPTARGTARVFGRALLADHVLSERFGAGWTQEPDFSRRLQISAPDVTGQEQAPVRQQAQGIAPGGRAREPVAGVNGSSMIQRPGARQPGGPGWDRRVPGPGGPGGGAVPRR